MWSSLHHQNWGPNHNKWDVSCRKLKMTSHPVQPASWTYPSIDVDIGWVDKLRKCIIQTGRSGYMVPQNPNFCGFTGFTPFLAAPKYEPNILEPWQNLRLGHQIGSLSRRSRSQISPAGDAFTPFPVRFNPWILHQIHESSVMIATDMATPTSKYLVVDAPPNIWCLI
jgi:hypothetical protein